MPSTAETLVYIVVTAYLIALSLGMVNASLHPILIVGLSMVIVFLFMRHDIYPRTEARIKDLIDY